MSRAHARRGGKRSARSRAVIERYDYAQTFLIVCEGERTEPNYFRAFRMAGDVRKIKVEGKGYNTLQLVDWASRLAAEEDYDQTWCVFDRDSFPAEAFNAAIEQARQQGIQVAYSNEAFELWYLLHFHYYDTGISRQDYCTKLSELLVYKYEKNDRSMYQRLLRQQEEAIRNARRLLEQYNPASPALNNPSTTVHLLVEELNRHLPAHLRPKASGETA